MVRFEQQSGLAYSKLPIVMGNMAMQDARHALAPLQGRAPFLEANYSAERLALCEVHFLRPLAMLQATH